jgi:hypothetical protein
VLDPEAEAMRWLSLMQADSQLTGDALACALAEAQRPLAGDALIRVIMEMLLLAKMQQLRQEDECVVCMDAARSVTLLPCGHRVLCATCCVNVRAANNEVRVGRGSGTRHTLRKKHLAARA